ncbi:MAG: helix-turn-helix domain-containing protein [Gemmatimonadetes bacterium]|nr:helix-turn-helix domain-containing protein [Gemmatimonadota bacterium]
MAGENYIAANITRLRLDRQLTQEELARKAGISLMALRNIERGTVVPRARTLTDLGKALRVPIRDLVTPVQSLETVRFRPQSQIQEDRLLRLVQQALEQEHISLGRAAEILGLSREEMRRYAREWAR